jgi:hypothetical protein
VPRIFSESRRCNVDIVLYRGVHPYAKLWLLCQKGFKIQKICLSVAVYYVIHHDFLSTTLTKAVYPSSTICMLLCTYINQLLMRPFLHVLDSFRLWCRTFREIDLFLCVFILLCTHALNHIATIITLFCSNNDNTEFNTSNPRPVVTDQYDILNTTNMGKYLCSHTCIITYLMIISFDRYIYL